MYRRNISGQVTRPDGQIVNQINYSYGPWQIGIKMSNVLCPDGRVRTAYYHGEPSTVWTQPCHVKVSGRSVTGHIFYDHARECFIFAAYPDGKNSAMLPVW